ncbi:MAG: caspase family protein, partial [Pseudomonadota bacterium]
DFADDDARDLVTALDASQSGLYAEVVPQVLLDADATRSGVMRALDSVREQMAQGDGDDLAVVHFSGHGAVIDGAFYLLTHDVDAADPVALRTTALSADDLRREIAKLTAHGRVIVLLDACRSGATTAAGAALAADADLLRDQLRGPNVTVLTSSTADEDSLEHRQWKNGAFTEAVLDALTTRADADRNGVISMVEMTRHVSGRVPQITNGAQNPGVDMRFESHVFVAGL